MTRRPRSRELRQRIAAEAARLLALQEARGPQDACRKAAARLGCRDRAQWPDNLEIERQLRQYRQLFQPRALDDDLVRLRRTALDAMRDLESFAPRLTGPVLRGTAVHDDPVRLHLYTDTPEAVMLYLMDRRIPFSERSVRLRFGDRSTRSIPLFEFAAGGSAIELVVLPPAALSDPPLDPWSQRPEAGAGIGQVAALLAGASGQR